MKQQITRDLFTYWDRLRGTRPAPDRDEIEPSAIRTCLADMFLLSYDPAAGHPFRLSGTAVCTMFGDELKGRSFAALWHSDVRPSVSRLIGEIAEDRVGMVACVAGHNAEDEALDLEMILLPLLGGGAAARLLGAFAPLARPYWLGARRIESLRMDGLRFVGPGLVPAKAGRLAAGLGSALPDGFTLYPAGGNPIPRNTHG